MKFWIKKKESTFISELKHQSQKLCYSSLSLSLRIMANNNLSKTKGDLSQTDSKLLGHSYLTFEVGQMLLTF